MSKDSKNKDTGLFTMIPDELLSQYDYKHLILLSQIARLSFTSGYCSASNEYLFERIHKLTRNKLNTSLDWLEDNGLIVRYNQLNMVNGDFLRTKRLIVLSQYSYGVYKSINAKAFNKMHEPIECPKGFLLHAEYLKRTKGIQKNNLSNSNKRKKKRLKGNNQDKDNNASKDLKQQEQPQNEHISQSKDNASSWDAFLSKQGIKTKTDNNRHPKKERSKRVFNNDKRNAIFIKFCNYYKQKGYDDYVTKATDKLNEYEEQLAVKSE